MSGSSSTASERKYKGIRCRKWGKWVSEIRVPGTAERLWLGSYATPEAAAVAHDVALYCLRGVSSPQSLNFPLTLPAGAKIGLSPRSVQKAASDAGMAIDARLKINSQAMNNNNNNNNNNDNDNDNQIGDQSWGSRDSSSPNEGYLSISVEDYDLY